ncbi:MAG: sigma-70 family RNA polymerase sigma factor [Rhizobiales bacterium]|nr:sigma-70 family RNA polymerase sigma factor [Hyphomicrobiales bacterium]
MSTSSFGRGEARAAFDRLLRELRPKLHRYCARMTGSVIDGEDVVQGALVKAIEAFPEGGSMANPEGWLFRITHNAALDFLRRRARQEAIRSDQDPDMIIDPIAAVNDRQIAAANLRTFMRLPVTQRSSIILMDVLGYSLEEVGSVTEMSIPAVKAALHRGRERLRELMLEPDELPPPVLAGPERALLAGYVDRFNARDFDAIRDMLADEVRLDLVNRTRRSGRRDVAGYFENYDRIADWHLVPGLVDRRPAVLVRDPGDPSGPPTYFVLLQWAGGRLVNIRDFRYARYATEGAELLVMG